MRKIKVFLCISVPLEGISEEYRKIVDECEMEPAIFCLPWPEAAIPPIGAKISFSTMPFDLDEFVVGSHEYVIHSEEEVRAEVNMTAPKDPDVSRHPPEVYLRCAAETGFVVFSSWKPIRDIFQETGLIGLLS